MGTRDPLQADHDTKLKEGNKNTTVEDMRSHRLAPKSAAVKNIETLHDPVPLAVAVIVFTELALTSLVSGDP